MRFLLILLLVLAVIALVRILRRGNAQGPQGRQSNRQAVSDMVSCERCGVHLVRSYAIETTPGKYRCPEHQDR